MLYAMTPPAVAVAIANMMRLLLVLCVVAASYGFYLPGVAPRSFEEVRLQFEHIYPPY
jgi:hypothetical protein